MKRILPLLLIVLIAIPVDAQRNTNPFGGRVVDLTYAFGDDTVYWPTAERFKLETDFEGTTDKGFYYSAYRYTAAEHGGTHLDAPSHFAKGRFSIDQIPLEQLMGSAIVIDVSSQCAKNPDYLVSIADFQNWERKYGRIPNGTIVFLRTGFGKFYPDAKKYLGTDERGAAAVAKLHFPGLDPKTAT